MYSMILQILEHRERYLVILTWACDKAGTIGQSTLLIWYKITKHLNGAFSISEANMTYEEYKETPTHKLLTMIHNVKQDIDNCKTFIRNSTKDKKPLAHRLPYLVVLSMHNVQLTLLEEHSRNLAEIDPVRDEKINELVELFWKQYGDRT